MDFDGLTIDRDYVFKYSGGGGKREGERDECVQSWLLDWMTFV